MVGMEDGVLPHFNNDDTGGGAPGRLCRDYPGQTDPRSHLLELRYGQSSNPSRFLRELAGRSQRICVWTGPRADGGDERLPLMSERERRRINENVSGQCPIERSRSSRTPGESTGVPSERPDRPRKKANDAFPPRHGRSWAPEEDNRLRTMFLKGRARRSILPVPISARKAQSARGWSSLALSSRRESASSDERR